MRGRAEREGPRQASNDSQDFTFRIWSSLAMNDRINFPRVVFLVLALGMLAVVSNSAGRVAYGEIVLNFVVWGSCDQGGDAGCGSWLAGSSVPPSG